jgi:hydroxymethylglutaryl-CoA reductase (NADPH)
MLSKRAKLNGKMKDRTKRVIDQKIPVIPGRGLSTNMSTKMRHDYMDATGIIRENISKSQLDVTTIQNNIESYVGSIELPVGLVGPLVFMHDAGAEHVYTLAGTLEGALVASMNRGAKAISQSGGFTAEVKWQKMSRSPMFLFEKTSEAMAFESYVKANFSEIKKKAESYSNHAQLLEIKSNRDGKVVHTLFLYQTGDASGQNMTTTCTWHAMLDLVERFTTDTGIGFVDFILEGNGSSDKKVSIGSLKNGRGVHVVAECLIEEKILKEVLRTTSKKMERAFLPSVRQAKRNGMHGYNINVANTVAAIFAATGQDLACIHESSVGILNIKAVKKGLKVRLTLPNLVIGTVGGGTHLSKQAEALNVMGCKGPNKIHRFAKLIAGFAMSLELSTFAAMVSGEFAKSHEKLGRNKPVNWLTRNELTSAFINENLRKDKQQSIDFKFTNNALLENGILTHIAGRISKKMIGFELLTATHSVTHQHDDLLLKSKALDTEVIKGLHVIAASIDPELSDLIRKHSAHLEYKNCHLKEGLMYAALSELEVDYIPKCWGTYRDDAREIHLILMDQLHEEDLQIFNAENNPEIWTIELIYSVIRAMHRFHADASRQLTMNNSQAYFHEFDVRQSELLYAKLIEVIGATEQYVGKINHFKALLTELLALKNRSSDCQVPKTIVHNDFNPRNLAVRKDGSVVVYDFELAVMNYPHRDLIEFLSFVLPEDFDADELFSYLEFDFSLHENPSFSKTEWFALYREMTLEFIVSRALFYEVAGIVVKYEFSSRVLKNALRMLHFLPKGA